MLSGSCLLSRSTVRSRQFLLAPARHPVFGFAFDLGPAQANVPIRTYRRIINSKDFGHLLKRSRKKDEKGKGGKVQPEGQEKVRLTLGQQGICAAMMVQMLREELC